MQFVAQKHERHDAPTPTLGSMFETNYAGAVCPVFKIPHFPSRNPYAAFNVPCLKTLSTREGTFVERRTK